MRPAPFEDGVTPLDADNLNERTVYAIGDLDALLTQNKTNLVAAINENKNNIDVLPNKWKQTFYVDQQDGDDSNLGSSDAPFKTLSKAINSIPTGGYGTVYIVGTCEVDNYIGIENKLVKLFSVDDSSKVIYNRVSINPIYVRNATLIHRINVELVNSQDTTPRIIVKGEGSGAYIIFSTQAHNNAKASVNLGDYTTINSSVGASLFYLGIDFTFGQSSYLCDIYHTAILNLEKGTVTVNGTAITDEDIVNHTKNLVRDGNGTPRNIVSNIIL